jgi:hypothetical protein
MIILLPKKIVIFIGSMVTAEVSYDNRHELQNIWKNTHDVIAECQSRLRHLTLLLNNPIYGS